MNINPDPLVRSTFRYLVVILLLVILAPTLILAFTLIQTQEFTDDPWPISKFLMELLDKLVQIPTFISAVLSLLPAMISVFCFRGTGNRQRLTIAGIVSYLLVLLAIFASFYVLPTLGDRETAVSIASNIPGCSNAGAGAGSTERLCADIVLSWYDTTKLTLNSALIYFGLLTGLSVDGTTVVEERK